jgi:hypothetical protein
MPVLAPPARPDPSAVEATPAPPERSRARRQVAGFGALLAGCWILLGAGNGAWLARDHRPPSWDPAVHLLSSLRYREALLDLGRGTARPGESLRRILAVDAFYPPFAPFTAALLTLGRRPDASFSTWALNQFFLALLMVGTFRLGRRVGGAGAGLAAAIVVATFAGVQVASHRFMLDLPLAAVTVLALDALLACDDFSRGRESAWLGLLCGIGMLTKWTFLFFLGAPLLFAVVRAASARSDRRRRLRHAALALALSGVLALPWYLVHAPNLVQDAAGFGGFSRGDWRRFPPVGSVASVVFYPVALARLLLAPGLLLLAAGVASGWRRRGVRRLVLLSLPAVVLLTFLPAKDDRYLIPLLPVAAVLATSWAGEARWPRLWKAAAVGGAAVASLLLAARRDPPARERWPIEELVAALPEAGSGAGPACVRVIPDTAEFHRFVFEYAALASHRRVEIAGDGRFPWFTDAVILKTGEQGARPGPALTMAAIERGEGAFSSVFRRTWQTDLPDGSRGEIWVRDVRPVAGIAPSDLVARFQAAVRREIERHTRSGFPVEIRVEPISDEETLRGRFRRVSVSARDAVFAGRRPGDSALRIRELECDLENVAVNPYRILETGELELLSLDAVTPRLALSEEDVNACLSAGRSDGAARVAFRDGRIRLSLRPKELPTMDLVLEPRIAGHDNLALGFESWRVAGIPLPASLLAIVASQYNPILKEMPCRVRLVAVRCERGLLRIEGGDPF